MKTEIWVSDRGIEAKIVKISPNLVQFTIKGVQQALSPETFYSTYRSKPKQLKLRI